MAVATTGSDGGTPAGSPARPAITGPEAPLTDETSSSARDPALRLAPVAPGGAETPAESRPTVTAGDQLERVAPGPTERDAEARAESPAMRLDAPSADAAALPLACGGAAMPLPPASRDTPVSDQPASEEGARDGSGRDAARPTGRHTAPARDPAPPAGTMLSQPDHRRTQSPVDGRGSREVLAAARSARALAAAIGEPPLELAAAPCPVTECEVAIAPPIEGLRIVVEKREAGARGTPASSPSHAAPEATVARGDPVVAAPPGRRVEVVPGRTAMSPNPELGLPGERGSEWTRSEPLSRKPGALPTTITSQADLPGPGGTERAPAPDIGRAWAVAAGPTLPVDRQELPEAARRPTDTPPVRRAARPASATPASDAGASASALAADRPTALERADARTPVLAASEARNLREGEMERHHPAGAADRVTLQVADAEGRQTRIRVAVLGDQVRATIVPPDAEAGRQLERRMDELQAALAKQGFPEAKVTVQAPRPEATVPWGGATRSGSSDTPSSGGTEPPPGDQRQGSGRRDEERRGDGHRHPHQRSRERDPHDRRRQ